MNDIQQAQVERARRALALFNFDSGLVEAEPEPNGSGKSYGEARPAYCFLAYASHQCPPTVATLPENDARVDTHGLETQLTFEWRISSGEEPHFITKTLRSGVIRPQVVPAESGFPTCVEYHYHAIAKNTGGKAEGAEAKEDSLWHGIECG